MTTEHEHEIKFWYRNYIGQVEERRVVPLDLRFDMKPHPAQHQQPGWVLTCWDLERHATRSFLLSNIIVPHEEPVKNEKYLSLVLKLGEMEFPGAKS